MVKRKKIIVLPVFTHERQEFCQSAMGAVLLPSKMPCEVCKAAELDEREGGLALPVEESQLNESSALHCGRD